MTNAEIAQHAAATQARATYFATHRALTPDLSAAYAEQRRIARAAQIAVTVLDALGTYPGLVYHGENDTYTLEEV